VMGNRSDRRLANLSNRRALEAVGPIRTSRANFHQGPEHHNQLPTEAGYTTATGSALTYTNDLALGAGSIYGGSNPSCSAGQSDSQHHLFESTFVQRVGIALTLLPSRFLLLIPVGSVKPAREE